MSVIAASQVVTGAGEVGPATLTIEDGRIVSVSPGLDPAAELVEGWIVPGYVDTHCHGGAGADFAAEDAQAVQRAIDHHRSHGATTLIASTVTEPIDGLVDQIVRLRAFVEAGELAGIHLEGPFLDPGHKGAHNPDLLRDPDPESVTALIEAGGPAIAMITIAPELPGAMAAIEAFVANGTVAAFGHTGADQQVARESIDHGVSIVTHLFNAMNGIHHRTPGPIPELLTDERVMVELICDGTHLHADVIRMAIQAAGTDRVGLVTDAMSATGQPDGDYILGTLAVQVRDGVARIQNADGTPGAIAGSTLTMDRAVEFVVNQVGCSIPEASAMAATTPARHHGLTDVGLLEPGRWADICVIDDRAQLRRVMRHGQWLD